ncbi:MAG TPA: hypothetical protein PKY63_12490 [Bacteroidales bacterium]|nr:hypothetical protein [Bacteroidales bacterium]
MNQLIWRPFFIFLSIINILVWSIAAIFPELYGISWPWSLGLLAVLNALSFLVFQRSLKQDSKASALIFLALTTGKMLLGMIYILVLVMGFGIDSLSDSLFFVILYLLFLALEVVVFTKNVKQDKR